MKTNTQPNTMLTIREASQLLNVHAHTLRRWNDQGLIAAHRIGPRGDRRFHRQEIAALLGEPTKHKSDQTTRAIHN